MINKIKVLLEILTNSVLPKKKNKKRSSYDAVVLTTEALGDNILFLDPFRTLEQYACRNNRILIFLCSKKNEDFWNRNRSSSNDNVKIIGVDIQKFKAFDSEVLDLLNSSVRAYEYENVFVPMHHTPSLMIASLLKAINVRTILYNEWKVGRNTLVNYIYKHSFTDVVTVSDDLFIGIAFEKLLCKVIENYNWEIGQLQIESKPRYIAEPYAVLAPIASNPDKSLTGGQIRETISYILSETQLYILLSDDAKSINYFEKICSEINSERLINLAGKTSLEEYMGIIKNSEFFIGCDSGGVHLSAALGTRTLAVCGYWSGAYLPYRIDKCLKGPFCAYSKKEYECKFCTANEGGMASSNSECFAGIKDKQTRICLADVNIEDALHEFLYERENTRS